MEVIATTRYVTLLLLPGNEVCGKIIFSKAYSVHTLYDFTSCLTGWCHIPSGGSLSLVPCSFQGSLCLVGVSVQRGLFWGSLCPGGSLSRGISVRETLPLPERDHNYGEERLVRSQKWLSISVLTSDKNIAKHFH